MRVLRGAFDLMEVIEAVGYVGAFFVLLGLLLTRRVPHDYQLWVGAALGAMVLFIIVGVTVQRYRSRKKN